MATSIRRDIQYGMRRLARQPGFTAVAVITLALGIGANSAIFSVVNAVLLRPLPYPRGSQLMLLGETSARNPRTVGVSARTYRDWTDQATPFSGIAVYQGAILNYTGPDGAVRLNAATVTSNLMSVLDVAPIAGRAFQPDDDAPSRPRVAMLSEGVWNQQFGRDPTVIGRTVLLGAQPFVIIGVMPAQATFPDGSADVWTLLSFSPDQFQSRASRDLATIGRLKDGVAPAQATAAMGVISARIAHSDPTENGWSVSMTSLYENTVANVRSSLLILQGAVLFVLLIACVNVAALLSARMSGRQHEIGLRTALGASRGEVLRLLLTESVLLGLVGGVGGIVLGIVGLRALVHAIPANSLPRTSGIGLDWHVLAFTLGLALGTGLLFGVVPALLSTRTGLTSVLGDSGRRTSASRGQRVFRDALVVSEVVLSLVLLVGAGLLMRTFVGLSNIDPGFKSQGVLVSSQLVLPPAKYGHDFLGNRFFTDLLGHLEGLPGVQAAGGITALPLQGNSSTGQYAVVGQPARDSGNALRAVFNTIAGDYFKTMGIPVERGRLFTEHDDRNAPPVAIINDALATTVFPHENPIGHRLTFGTPPVEYEVVGVVGSSRQFGLSEPPQPEVFTSYMANPITYLYVLTKSSGDPSRLVPAIREQVRALDPDQPVGHRTLTQQFQNSIADSRFYTMLLGMFGATALLLAAVGIYGIMSYVVAQRTREFGIRLALGASPAQVRGIVMGVSLRLVAIGVVVGLGLSWLLTRYLSSLLYGVTTTDAPTFGGVAVVLTAVAMVAGYLPARRATRVAPVIALRAE